MVASQNSLGEIPQRRLAAPKLTQVLYSTLCNEAIQDLALQQYDLAEDLECTFFVRQFNDIYLLRDGARKFALRVARCNWRSRKQLDAELSAIMALDSQGIDVARPVARRDGDWITEFSAPEGLRRAVLFEWQEGRIPRYTNVHTGAAYGRALARLHAASDGRLQDPNRPTIDLPYLLDSSLELIRPRLKTRPEDQGRLNELADRIRANLTPQNLKACDWGFCHGDVYSTNARVDGDKVALFDFDYCGAGWRLYDLACYKFGARWENCEQNGWKPFIEGYLYERPGARESLRYLGWFMVLRYIFAMGQWILLSASDGIGYPSEEMLDDLIPGCLQIEAEVVTEHV